MFAIIIPFFDLLQSCEANPFCCWHKIAPETVLLADDGAAVLVSQKGESVCFSCNFDEFCRKWYYYFDIGTDYSLLHDNLLAGLKFEPKLQRVLQARRGARLFKVEWFEGLLKAFLLAAAPEGYKQAVESLMQYFSRIQALKLYQRPSARFKPFPTPAALCACGGPVSVEQAVSGGLPESAAVGFSCFVDAVFNGNFEQENMGKTAADFEQYFSSFAFVKYLNVEQRRKFAIYVWRYCIGDKSCYVGGDFSKYSEFNNFAYFVDWYGNKLKDIAGFVEFVTKAG